MNIYEQINDFTRCTDFLEYMNRALDAVNQALQEKNKEPIVRGLYERVRQYYLAYYLVPSDECNVLNGVNANNVYFSLKLPQLTTPVKTLKELKIVIETILDEFIEPVGEIISVDDIVEITEYLDNRFDFSSKVFHEHKAVFSLIDKTNKNYNSECLLPENYFCLYHMKDDKTNPIYVFFHELGHALHCAYTKDISILPENVINLLSEICFPTIKSTPDYQKQEIVADVFASGLMYDSMYDKFNPFNFHEEDKKCMNIIVKKILESVVVSKTDNFFIINP